jgi:hypothetical protein
LPFSAIGDDILNDIYYAVYKTFFRRASALYTAIAPGKAYYLLPAQSLSKYVIQMPANTLFQASAAHS